MPEARRSGVAVSGITVTATISGTTYLYLVGGHNGTSNQTTIYKSTLTSPSYTITRTLSSTDLSAKGAIQFDYYSSAATPHTLFEFSDDGGTTWQSYLFSVSSTGTWETKTMDISNLATSNRNSITKIRFRGLDLSSSFTDYFDNIKAVQTAFSGTAPSATFTNGIYGAANLAINAQGTGAVRINHTTSQPQAGTGGLELYDGWGGLVFNVSGGGNASASGTLSFTGASSSAALKILGGQNLPFQTSVGGDSGLATRMTLTNAGRLGIGITSPLAALDVAGILGTIPTASISATSSFAALVVDNKGAGDILTASSSGLNRFVIKQDGNVGIGTAVPAFALDIQNAQTATAAAQIFNTSTNTGADGLVIKLGNTSTTAVANTNHFLSFETSGIGIVGSVRGSGADGVQFQTGGIADFAEYLPKDENTDIPYGSIVCIGNDGKVSPCKSSVHMEGGRTIAGVASEHPFLLGGKDMGKKSIAVAFVGQVNTLVSTESGEIKPGDMIAVSQTAGVGKKATEKGFVVGRALEAFTCPAQKNAEFETQNYAEGFGCVGGILALVNSTWFDPTIMFAADGSLALQGETLQAQTTASNAVDTKKSAFADLVDLTDSLNLTDLSTLSSSLLQNQDFVKRIFNLGVEMPGVEPGRLGLRGQSSEPATPTPLTLSKLLADIVNDQASLSARLAILESITNPVIANDSAAISDGIASSYNPRNDVETATMSSLMVLGRTTLSDLGITGNITTGLMTIKGMGESGSTSINTVGDLYLQNNLLGGINMFADKVTIDTSGNIVTTGNITAKTATLEKINFITQTPQIISDTEVIASGSAGTIILKANNTYLKVKNLLISDKSSILLTPKAMLNNQTLYIKEQQAEDHFTIGIEQPLSKDIEINYLIVN